MKKLTATFVPTGAYSSLSKREGYWQIDNYIPTLGDEVMHKLTNNHVLKYFEGVLPDGRKMVIKRCCVCAFVVEDRMGCINDDGTISMFDFGTI